MCLLSPLHHHSRLPDKCVFVLTLVSNVLFYLITPPSLACGLSLSTAPLQALACGTACPNTSSPESLPVDKKLVRSLLAHLGSAKGPPAGMKLTSATLATFRRLAPLLLECLERMWTLVDAGPPAAPGRKHPS